jgi:cytochrome b pre-mRNA-processing protein 3
MGLIQRLFGQEATPLPMADLYAAIVAEGRAEHWYVAGAVPDTIDGRFDMIAAVLAMVLLRMEGDAAGPAPSAAVTERFVDDMDGQLRQIGIGDLIVGKHVSKMMGMLGGRLGAYRDGLAAGDLRPALVRNLYRGEAPSPAALDHVATELQALRDGLDAVPLTAITEGRLQA